VAQKNRSHAKKHAAVVYEFWEIFAIECFPAGM
jgi:hypothetical protein